MRDSIVRATKKDVPEILKLIKQLAKYERLENEVVATEKGLEKTLFGPKAFAEVILAREGSVCVGFALYFHSYSTFLALPGIYLEDLYVREEHRGKGYGKGLLGFIAKQAVQEGCGRLEWSVLDWNKTAIDFYLSLGSVPNDGWTLHRVTGEALRKLSALG